MPPAVVVVCKPVALTCLIALLLSLSATVKGSEAAANLAEHASFEQPGDKAILPAGWHGDAAVYRCDTDVARTGTASLRFTNDDPSRYRLASQRVPLKPGRTYRYSGWVKTKEIAGDDSGATLCIEWSDKNGKWLGGSYATGISGTKDWTRITGVAHVPNEAGRCSFSCYVRRGMTGTAWFDDVEIVRVFQPPMRSMITAPVYRGRITATGPKTVQAVVRLNLCDCEVPLADLRVRAALVTAEGGAVLTECETKPSGEQDRVEPVRLALTPQNLTPGKYRVQIILLEANGKTLQTDEHDLTCLPDTFQPKSYIDPYRRLLVDGEPFFPLGMYFSGIKEDELRQYAESKFNCLMPYGSPNKQQMDLADELGLKVIYSIKDWYHGSRWCPKSITSPDDEEPIVRARVQKFRDHPALLAWYLNDELPQAFLPRLEAHQRWVAEEDPDHPTWVVLYQYNQVAAYVDTFDVIGTDPYPIGRKPASMAGAWTAETFRQVEGARPMWQVPQLHNWANYAKNDADRTKGRTPTYDEVRSMAWQCIAEGATGLVFYSWYDVLRNPDVDFDQQWTGLKRLAAEIDRMAPIVLSIEPAEAVTVDGDNAPAWLHCLVRRHGGKLYLIAVNDGDGEGDVTFRLPAKASRVCEMSENHVIEPEDGLVFHDRLAPLAVHLYEIE